MTMARKHQVDLNCTPYYHCISRCVRRAYLCGSDSHSGRNYDHRKAWLVGRLKYLASEVFAVDICAYAVMDNHYHVVLRVDEQRAKSWDEETIMKRWKKLFGPLQRGQGSKVDKEKYRANRERVYDPEVLRERLHDISWFMRCVNEKIARWANEEDECRGRFWEGRFKSQALLDEGAILTCMAYVDLNPVRAGISDRPETSPYTSIEERIHHYWHKRGRHAGRVKQYQSRQGARLMGVMGKGLMGFASAAAIKSRPEKVAKARQLPGQRLRSSPLPVSREEYFELVDHTGRLLRQDKPGAIPEHLTPILQRLELDEDNWLDSVARFREHFFQVVGKVEDLSDYAEHSRVRVWVKGKSGAKVLYGT